MQRPLLDKDRRETSEVATEMCPLEGPERGAWSTPTGVNGLLDDNRQLPLEHGAQDLDDHDQTATEHQQGGYQQDEANEKIGEAGIHKEVLA